MAKPPEPTPLLPTTIDVPEALGLQDGARLMLHIKNTPIIKGCVKPAPLPVHTFASEGYGFFMNIETPQEAFSGDSTGTRVQGSSWLWLEDAADQQSNSLAGTHKQGLPDAGFKMLQSSEVGAFLLHPGF